MKALMYVMFAIVPDNEGTVDYFLNTNNINKWKKSCFHLIISSQQVASFTTLYG